MKLWMDAEFNGWSGELISLALVPEFGNPFYEVLPCPNPVEWVKHNVIPFLNKQPIDIPTFKQRLGEYLRQWNEVHIVATWPSDFVHLMNSLIVSDGVVTKKPKIVMEMPIPTREGVEMMMKYATHNALDDATVLKVIHP